MFGKNVQRPQALTNGLHLRVQSVFSTIQGEGPYSGYPALFIRLHGCNLACGFCFVPSTMITMHDGTYMRIDQVRTGDSVLSWDGEKFVSSKVVRIHRSISKRLVRVRISGSRNIWCTPEHPFLVSGVGFVSAGQLTTGMKLIHFDASERMKRFNPSFNGVKPKTVKQRKAASLRFQRTWKENPALRAGVKQRMLDDNPMRRPGVAIKGFQTRVERNKFKMTGLEKKVLDICKGLPLDYVGDGKLIIGDVCPDFSVRGKRKLIEVWASDAPWASGRGRAYEEKRRAAFTKAGYESLFLPVGYNDLRYFTGGRKALRQRIAQFISNGTTVLGVDTVAEKAYARLYGSLAAERVVYNLEVENTHTYLANRVVVHNCDTDFESRPTIVGIDSLVTIAQDATRGHQFPLVVITGGEPLLQNIVPLVEALADIEITSQIETAGTVWVPGLELTPVTIVCSPKTPKVHPMVQAYCRAWKYIVRDDKYRAEDGLPCKATQAGHEGQDSILARPERSDATIYLQPCEEYLHNNHGAPLPYPQRTDVNTALAVRLCMEHGYRLSIQVHKVVNLP